MEPINAADSAVARIAVAVQASMDDMVAAAVQEIWDQVPAYPGSNDAGLREDVARHMRAIFDVFLAGLTGGQPTRRSEFTMTREQATRRVAQGITLADFLKAFRIGQLTLWQGVLAAAGDDVAAREEALAAVARIMTVIEVGSTVAAEAYLEAQQHAVAESDRVRRDLLEAGLAAELMRRFEERFGVPILEGYGLSETSPVATFNRVDRPRRPGSVGLPVWGV